MELIFFTKVIFAAFCILMLIVPFVFFSIFVLELIVNFVFSDERSFKINIFHREE